MYIVEYGAGRMAEARAYLGGYCDYPGRKRWCLEEDDSEELGEW